MPTDVVVSETPDPDEAAAAVIGVAAGAALSTADQASADAAAAQVTADQASADARTAAQVAAANAGASAEEAAAIADRVVTARLAERDAARAADEALNAPQPAPVVVEAAGEDKPPKSVEKRVERNKTTFRERWEGRVSEDV